MGKLTRDLHVVIELQLVNALKALLQVRLHAHWVLHSATKDTYGVIAARHTWGYYTTHMMLL